jgi:VanZ family protein
VLCCIAIMALLVCTLWPLNPFPQNRVHWLPGANGIAFDGAGLVMGKKPLRFKEREAGESCALELLLEPSSVESLYTILSFYNPRNPKQFLVRQWTDGLLVSHEVVSERNKSKATKFYVDHAFHQGTLLLLTMVSGPNGTTVYLDGRGAQVFPRFRITQGDLAGQIVIGTSPTDYQPWPGQIRGLAIYSRELSSADAFRHYLDWTGAHPPDLERAVARYSFTEEAGRDIHNGVTAEPDLEIPMRFSVPHQALLSSPLDEFSPDWLYVKDIVLNVAGFVPLGLVVCTYFAWTKSRRAAILHTVLAGGILSFVIEVLQAYIPQRVSGTTDIITNTLGAALGALVAQSSVVRKILERIRLIPGKSGGQSS